MSNSNVAEDIKNTVSEFIGELRDNIFTRKEEKADMLKIEIYFTSMGDHVIANHIVAHILPYSHTIKKREIEFFLNNKTKLFASLPKDRVDYLADMVRKKKHEGGLAEEDRKVIWDYLDTLVALAELYKKNK